jgi:hypothetical protein
MQWDSRANRYEPACYATEQVDKVDEITEAGQLYKSW